MPRGGARINSGPKPGYLAERRQELQDLVARSGVDPAERILSIAKEAEGRGDWQLAMAGYKEILPLLYPRLKASQVAHDVVPDGIVERLHEGRMRVLAARSTTTAHTS